MADKQSRDFASSEGGPQKDWASDMRNKQAEPGKMENELEAKKDSKVSRDSADQVAGRQGKGVMTGMLDKLGAGGAKSADEAPADKDTLGGRGA